MKQKYIDIELDDAKAFDCVQYKYDGHWCQLTSIGGELLGTNRVGRRLFQWRQSGIGDRVILIGEYIHGTAWSLRSGLHGKFLAFDCLSDGNQDLASRPYADRVRALEVCCRAAGTQIVPVTTYAISEVAELWRDVADGRFEGLILRRWGDRYADPVARVKRVVTADYLVVGTEPGRGKLAGRLGAWRIRSLVTGYEGTVSAPMDEDGPVIGRIAELEGNELYPSGALRHPRFRRWRAASVS
jgi:ATP-dependent DNA ligase